MFSSARQIRRVLPVKSLSPFIEKCRHSSTSQQDILEVLSPTGEQGPPRTSIPVRAFAPPSATTDQRTIQEKMEKLDPAIYMLHCQASPNNTITTFAGPTGKLLGRFSGYRCAMEIFKVIEKTALTEHMRLHLCFKGFGQGRDAMAKALTTAEGQAVKDLIFRITDRTPLKIGGTRAKKQRRL